MTTIAEAVAARRTIIAELESEILRLEDVASILETPSRQASPRAPATKRKPAKPAPAAPDAPRRAPAICKTCGKQVPPRAKGPGRQPQFHPECVPSKAGRAAKTKTEPDPVPTPTEKELPAVAASAPAERCPMLDFNTGRRCDLPTRHPMPHNTSGRPFTTALNPSELGGSSRKVSA